MNKKVGIVVVIILVLLLGLYVIFQFENKEQAQVGDLTISHQLGETIVTKNPQKVIVFDFGILDTLNDLNIDVIGLPKSSTVPRYLSKYQDEKYANVGSLQEPNFEKIYELKPDLIIISTRQMALYDRFKEIAPTIYLAIDNNDYMNSFKMNTRNIGKIFDKEDQVEDELIKIDEKIANLHSKAKATNLKAVVLLLNSNTLSAYGEGSRFGIIHKEFGLEAVDKNIEVSTHGQSVNFEYIKTKNPDLIFVIDRGTVVQGGTPSTGFLDNELVNSTNAAKNGQIHYLDAEVWYLSVGGLTSTIKMIDEIAAVFKK